MPLKHTAWTMGPVKRPGGRWRNRCALIPVLAAALTALAPAALRGADWPAYKHDGSRSSVTAEGLEFPLAAKWAYQPSQPPMPAWPEPGKEVNRTDFDYAFQPVVAAGLVYFGSSADDAVRALDAATGEPVWRFITSGPVRFAPAIAHGRAYVASDDGYLYCLDAKTGKQVWRFRCAPEDDYLLGNGRLISHWPCRTGALVVDDVVYCTGGMWPTEGVYVYALDAASGKELWCNDSSGSICVDLPHAGASGFSGVAPQGCLVASQDVLLVPTGRSVPAAFNRRTGRLLYYKPEKTHYHGTSYGGGVWCMAAGDLYFNPSNRSQNPSKAAIGEAEPGPQDGMIAYSLASGEQQSHIRSRYRALVAGGVVYAAGNGSVDAIDLDVLRRKRRIAPGDAKWTAAHAGRVYCLAMAGPTVLTGNRDSIAAFNAADGKPVWSTKVDGQVRGMAISDGRLVAATHRGTLLCFGPGKATSREVRERPRVSPVSDEQRREAQQIIQRSGKTEGYALVVGDLDSRLAEALAAQTQLHVVSVMQGASRAAAERVRLLTAGVLGSRVAVHAVEDLGSLHLPPYFAELVVVSRQAKGVSGSECYRCVRPCGGTLCFVGFDGAAQRTFAKEANIPQVEIRDAGQPIVRGVLPGSADWRYPWADGGRSGVGKESRVQFPLRLLWFGGPGPGRLVDRHLMGSPPVSANGRVFMQGDDHVVAFDAYNGRELWSAEVKEVGRKYAQYYSSSLVADDDSVYVVQHDKCRRLDQATGRIRHTYPLPASVVQGTPAPAVQDYVDVEWPKVWHVVGPFPKGKPPLSNDVLKTVPERVTVKGQEVATSRVEAARDIIDFAALFGGYGLKPVAPGKTAPHPRRGKRYSFHDVGRIGYAFAKINCPKAGKLLVGAGADWWMQWFLDGKPVFDTLKGGNVGNRETYCSRQVCSPKDFLFDVDVTAGEHVLAVMVKSGSKGWALSSASMAKHAKELMPVATGANPNLPNLRDLSWGYLSVTDDLLLGSYNVPVTEGQAAESHLIWRSESKAVFALSKDDGSLRWVFRPKPDRIVANIEIAFGDGRLFLIDGTSKADLAKATRRRQKADAKLTLVALDLSTGSEFWRQDDVPLLRDRAMPTRLKSNLTHLFMGLPNWGHLIYADGVVVLGANAAYDATTGRKLWQKTIRPRKLPIVYRDRLITGAYACDLRTGEQCTTTDILTGRKVPWRYTHAYGCGPTLGCQHLLFFRSGADGFFDMETEGTTNFGGVRPGCARSILAANGLLIHPQGYSGCACCYSYKTCLALVSAPERDDTWYAFPRRVSDGQIKQLAINFGAPGDRKDAQGRAWLSFPRPMIASACPAPVTVLMDNAACHYQRRATAAIQGTDSSWLYSSGLSGQGRIAVDLDVQLRLVLPRQEAAPVIDGKLDDPCWKGVRAVPFENTAFSMLGAGIDFRMFRDAENIYFHYSRRPIGHALAGADEATLRKSDSLEMYLADRRKRVGIRAIIQRNGSAIAQLGTVGRSRQVDPEWKCEWHYAVQETDSGWAAEVALPIRTLTEAGIILKRLQLNCMSQNLTQSGLEAVFLTDPLYANKFRQCCRFRPVIELPSRRLAERTFTVRLHFAETAGTARGRRVFDVAIQGKTVLKALDVVAEAGGGGKVLVKECRGVVGAGQVVIDLTRSRTAPVGGLLPMICGVEVVEDGWAGQGAERRGE